MELAGTRVLVTGASGYIACHVIDLLLRSPKQYLVRGTVRDLKNEKKVKPIRDLAGEDGDRLELVEADLMKEEGWDAAVKDCRYVLHLASPFPNSQPRDEQEVIKPAVTGTRNVLTACLRNNVEHVVVTSSIAAIMSGNDNKNLFTDEDWSNIRSPSCTPYDKSKTLAQQEARKIYKESAGKIKLTTINPGFVLGPAFYDNESTSGLFMRRILTNDMPGIPDLAFGSVDVRDVAAAHIFAFEKPDTDGKRYILVQGTHHWKIMLKILQNEFGKYGYKFPSITVGSFLMKIYSLFDSETRTLLPMVGREIRFVNTPSIEELGIKYIDVRKSLIEMAYRMIKMGSVPNKLPK